MELKLKKFFTTEQLSNFFHIAVLINVIELISDVIVYRYFPDCQIMKITNQNLSNLSFFMISLILVSQALLLFIKRYQNFIQKYTFIAFSCMACMIVFLFWFLRADNNIQENFVIFLSSASRYHHDNKILILTAAIFMMLLFNLYTIVQSKETINQKTAPEILKSTFTLLLKEYLFIFIGLLGVFHLDFIKDFSRKILGDNESLIMINVDILEIVLPAIWIIAIFYYLYHRIIKKDDTISK